MSEYIRKCIKGGLVGGSSFMVGFMINMSMDISTLKANIQSVEEKILIYVKSIDQRLSRIEAKLDE